MARELILLVEDDTDIQELVTYNLTKEGFQVTAVASGEDALEFVDKNRPDLVLLDLMLPETDGLEVCRILKGNPDTAHIPVVMLTARGEEADIVVGLEMGAVDYITKPFSNKVLIARLRAVLRRREASVPEEDTPIKIHNLAINPGRHEALIDGKRVDLTLSEFRLLQFLARRPGWVFTRYQIVDALHGTDYPVTDRSIDVQIVGLRKKLGKAGVYIETVRGVGYRFKE
jgi:two-component system alkaline phosphatase synthesis response regulator PhoP